MGRSLLIALAAIGLGFGLSCQIPSTLGLPCEIDAHCDAGQSCNNGACAAAPAGSSNGTSSGDLDPSTSTGAEGETTAVDPTTSGADSTTMSVLETSSSTGVACGTDTCDDLDILIVFDNSPSMIQWIAPLANSLGSLIALIITELDGVCSFRIALTSSNEFPLDNPVDCQFPGALLYRPESCGGGEGVLPWWSNEQGTASEVLDELRCLIIDQGTGGSNNEIMLGALLGALDPITNAGDCNLGFRRSEVPLFVLFITDENDPTPMDELDTAAENFLMWEDPAQVAFISVVADDAKECPWNPDGTDSDGEGAEVPSGLNGFLALSGIPFDQQATVDICEDEMYMFDDAFDVFEATCGR